MEPTVLYEDDYLVALNKPSGMVVNRGFGAEGTTLQDWIESNFQFSIKTRSDSNFQEMRSGVVHRLDKETSGVILVAKTVEVFEELQKQFKERTVKKVYIALLHGRVEPKEGVINAPVARLPKNRRRFGVVSGGREARTGYCVVSSFQSPISNEVLSLVEFYPETGRTHQIRIHAKHIGHPVVGDYLYVGRKTYRKDKKWCSRMFLHAKKLEFKHPKSGKRVDMEAELPHDLQDVLNSLR